MRLKVAGPRDAFTITETAPRPREKDASELALEKWRQHEIPRGGEVVAAAKPLTINIEAVPVQGEGAQAGDTVGLTAQLPVQLLSVQPGAHEVRAEGADNIHPSGCSMIPTPEEGGAWGCGIPKGVLSGVGSKKVEVRKLR